MRKSLIASIISLSLVGGVFANSVTTSLTNGQFVNLLSGFNQPVYVNQITITAGTNNVTATIVDTYTNSLTYTNAAYTNTTSYLTNYINTWTNFYGATNSTTNIALIDVSTNAVAATTNNFPVRLSVATGFGLSTAYSSVNAYFNNGIWATNTSPSNGLMTITVNYR